MSDSISWGDSAKAYAQQIQEQNETTSKHNYDTPIQFLQPIQPMQIPPMQPEPPVSQDHHKPRLSFALSQPRPVIRVAPPPIPQQMMQYPPTPPFQQSPYHNVLQHTQSPHYVVTGNSVSPHYAAGAVAAQRRHWNASYHPPYMQPVNPTPPPEPEMASLEQLRKLDHVKRQGQRIHEEQECDMAMKRWTAKSIRVRPGQSQPLVTPSVWQVKLKALVNWTQTYLKDKIKHSSEWDSLRAPQSDEILYFDYDVGWEGAKALCKDSTFVTKTFQNQKRQDSSGGKVMRTSERSLGMYSSRHSTSSSSTSSKQSRRRRSSSSTSRSSSLGLTPVRPAPKKNAKGAQKGKQKSKAKANAKKKQNKKKEKIFVAPVTLEEQYKRETRLQRFGKFVPETPQNSSDRDLDLQRNIGISTTLEKSYLRLTDNVDFSLVRPIRILRQSLEHCFSKYRQRGDDWAYLEDQLRSIRQDLTVQGIRDEFAIEVYERNAKIALENSDLSQFNQCQGQLMDLYRLNGVKIDEGSRAQFLCYRIVYLTLQELRMDLLRLIGELTNREANHPLVLLGTRFRKAYVEGNYERFLKLRKEADAHCNMLIGVFLPKIRMMYLVTISKAHFKLSAAVINKRLQFENASQCLQFLLKQGAIIVQGIVECRKSSGKFEASPLLQSRKLRALIAPGARPSVLT
eukprot:GHVP01002911.1.p1 GENE.GHVP01002911.1~~GHVP01002911.1.p1  ORF type:complete len:681 (-),score=74.43 GHVP01002911.1:53-2095(-)